MGYHKDLVGSDLHISKLRVGLGSPVGVVSASIAGEAYFDVTNDLLYVASAIGTGNWKLASTTALTSPTITGGATLVGGTVAPSTPSANNGILYIRYSGTTPNKTVILAYKNESGEEIIVSTVIA